MEEWLNVATSNENVGNWLVCKVNKETAELLSPFLAFYEQHWTNETKRIAVKFYSNFPAVVAKNTFLGKEKHVLVGSMWENSDEQRICVWWPKVYLTTKTEKDNK